MVEPTQVQDIPEIMRKEIHGLEDAIAFWEFAAQSFKETMDPMIQYSEEVIRQAREPGSIVDPNIIETAEAGISAWQAPVARVMELLSWIRGYAVPEDGLGPTHAAYDGTMDHYNTVVCNTEAAVALCQNLWPEAAGEEERWVMSRLRAQETAALLPHMARPTDSLHQPKSG